MPTNPGDWQQAVDVFRGALDRTRERRHMDLEVSEIGQVIEVGQGFARVAGLPGVQADELVRFTGGRQGLAFNLNQDDIGVMLMDAGREIQAGERVERTHRVMDVPVGEELIGRVIDPAGRPRDGRGAIRGAERLPIERPAPGVLERDPVETPLQTGIKVIDALIPIGRGQRELIVGDRQTGKTAIAVDTILNQAQGDVVCIYCAIGQRSAGVARVIAQLREQGALQYTTVVAATGDDPSGQRYAAPYAATSIGEYFMREGRDVLIVYDDLTRHARAYRELSLLLRRPPGREAYPGDIFYIHSRLLERSTHLIDRLGGGSLTALPIIETQSQNISAYIPTNLISITDGQVYLSPRLFRQGVLPAVDVGRSVSRVGGKAQLPAYRAVAGDLRLAYSQFEELERFSRYGTRIDQETRQSLEHGRRIREVLKQPQSSPLQVAEQIAVLLAASEGRFDDLPIDRVEDAQAAVVQTVPEQHAELAQRIAAGQKLNDQDRDTLRTSAAGALERFRESDRQPRDRQDERAADDEEKDDKEKDGRQAGDRDGDSGETQNHGNA
jgi:F-type H+-transporting ATPase subunit alpha